MALAAACCTAHLTSTLQLRCPGCNLVHTLNSRQSLTAEYLCRPWVWRLCSEATWEAGRS